MCLISVKDLLNNSERIRRKLQIYSHLLIKSRGIFRPIQNPVKTSKIERFEKII